MSPDGAGVTASLKIISMLAALNALDTMAAYKIMMSFSKRHAGVFRRIIGAMLVAHRLDALPALIYGRGSKDPEMHMFAVKWIRDMGNPLLSEQVQGIKNSRRLAQLIEAYAQVNELDAVNVTLSLTSHSSVFVRNAARKAILKYGQNAKWAIFREYENIFGEEPDKESQPVQWLERLYKYADERRDADFLKVFSAGLKFAESSDFKKMNEAYKSILASEPLFEKRDQMAAGYLAYARYLESDNEHDKAVWAYKMAKRLSVENSELFHQADSRLIFLQAEKNREAGALDKEVYLSHKDVLKNRGWISGSENSAHAVSWVTVMLVSLLIFIAATLVYFRIKQ
jgi:hypothetical protein